MLESPIVNILAKVKREQPALLILRQIAESRQEAERLKRVFQDSRLGSGGRSVGPRSDGAFTTRSSSGNTCGPRISGIPRRMLRTDAAKRFKKVNNAQAMLEDAAGGRETIPSSQSPGSQVCEWSPGNEEYA